MAAGKPAFAIVERNVRLQTQLISDLLDVSRIISGKIHLDREAVDLPAVVEAAIDACRSAFEHVVVDLTGFDRTGELGRAVATVDATAIVAGVGITREAEILNTRRAFEGYPLLGVVLVDPRTTRKQR